MSNAPILAACREGVTIETRDNGLPHAMSTPHVARAASPRLPDRAGVDERNPALACRCLVAQPYERSNGRLPRPKQASTEAACLVPGDARIVRRVAALVPSGLYFRMRDPIYLALLTMPWAKRSRFRTGSPAPPTLPPSRCSSCFAWIPRSV